MIELSLHSGEGTRSECRLRGLQIEECCRYKLFSKLFVQSKHAVVRTTPITASDCFSWKGMQFFPVKSYTNQCAIFIHILFELHFTSQLGLLSTHKETHMKSWFGVLFSLCPFNSIATACAAGAQSWSCICLGPWGWALTVIPKTS